MENQDNRPNAKILPFPGRLDKTTEITPEGLEEDIRSRMTEEELEKAPPISTEDEDS